MLSRMLALDLLASGGTTADCTAWGLALLAARARDDWTCGLLGDGVLPGGDDGLAAAAWPVNAAELCLGADDLTVAAGG